MLKLKHMNNVKNVEQKCNRREAGDVQPCSNKRKECEGGGDTNIMCVCIEKKGREE